MSGAQGGHSDKEAVDDDFSDLFEGESRRSSREKESQRGA